LGSNGNVHGTLSFWVVLMDVLLRNVIPVQNVDEKQTFGNLVSAGVSSTPCISTLEEFTPALTLVNSVVYF
jgi:hypothetical protein